MMNTTPPALPWYTIHDAHLLDSPALVIYPQRVQANINRLLASIDDKQRLRTHVKTHKSNDVLQLLLQSGISRFKCATIAEAEMLAAGGARDILLAYQPTGPKLQRFIALVEKYPAVEWACLCDHEKTARQQSAAFTAAGITVPVYIDLNVGMDRTGILPALALDLYQLCATLPGIQPVGLHVYDGHLRQRDLAQRKQAVNEAFALVTALADAIVKAGLATPLIVAGGSPSYPIHAQRAAVQCSPGTFIFWDKGYIENLPEQPFEPAALLLTRVVSLPTPTTLCLDLGHKSVTAENDISKRVVFLNAPDLQLISQSEEHGIVSAPEGHQHTIGELLYALPWHICPSVALYERAQVIEDGKRKGEWRITARDRQLTI
ncbi:MAG: D-TA family PLP-dependent enzyme [Candidatus Pseudobacter hemicellulosilyticus]|uniref:D-TA family PLP-dependent enzyme n=1 Tax=Candidatus Pseudobacter hemicellulosilyticus TaxID=3121375 RepID=A0AAJ6BJE3_9BACT|nr:MAG: D-TA family PLP-dependent enzyme [Pseudobacter sp.]